MREDIKRRWLALLESGEYNFGKYRIYDLETDCHCALGVLVELALEDEVLAPEVEERPFYGKSLKNISGFDLSSSILEWAGMSKDDTRKVGKLNDSPDTESYAPVTTFIKENL